MTDAQVIELLRQAQEYPSEAALLHRIYRMCREDYLQAQKLLENLNAPKARQEIKASQV